MNMNLRCSSCSCKENTQKSMGLMVVIEEEMLVMALDGSAMVKLDVCYQPHIVWARWSYH